MLLTQFIGINIICMYFIQANRNVRFLQALGEFVEMITGRTFDPAFADGANLC